MVENAYIKGLVYNERLDIYVDPNWEKEKIVNNDNGFGMVKLHLKGSLLKEKEVANILSVSPAKLARDRFKKRGLPYYKLNGSVRYSVKDIKSYLRVNRINGH